MLNRLFINSFMALKNDMCGIHLPNFICNILKCCLYVRNDQFKIITSINNIIFVIATSFFNIMLFLYLSLPLFNFTIQQLDIIMRKAGAHCLLLVASSVYCLLFRCLLLVLHCSLLPSKLSVSDFFVSSLLLVVYTFRGF